MKINYKREETLLVYKMKSFILLTGSNQSWLVIVA